MNKLFPRNRLKKNKYQYCKQFTEYLKHEIVDTNIFVFMRYEAYRLKITPMYKAKTKRRTRKGSKIYR